ncbi:regulatory protein RecX [Firmicutes bacterium OM04-13BH]|uniref:regulatory protein RecX n=1 Tax=Blautia stercoris TaxID=871664 RepID=UPI000E3EF427|nr:regulatory protein RecX [Firmicutes bacterium AM10-47]RHV47709.1 regulatory protein RecX [Firmicutes bacterium OM04-13BH]
MEITKIQALTKQKYRIFLDGESAFAVYKGELSRYHLEEGAVLPPEVYEELVNRVLKKRATLRAMHILERTDKTEAQLRRKLEESEYPKEAVESAIAYVTSYGYLDDRRYAEHYIEWKKQGKGKARLKMELVQKGISREIIEEVLESTDFGETREMIRQIILKKRKTDIPMNEKEKQRLYGFLMRKGFSSSDILAVMREEEWRNNIEF